MIAATWNMTKVKPICWDAYLNRRLVYPKDREFFDTLEEILPLAVWKAKHSVVIDNGQVVSNILREWLWSARLNGLITQAEFAHKCLYVP